MINFSELGEMFDYKSVIYMVHASTQTQTII